LALALLPAHLPKVITWHSDLVPYPRLQKPYLPLLRRVLRSADALVAATPAHLRSLQIPSDIAAHKKHVIPYGMDFSPFEATPALLRRAAECRARAGLGGSLGAPDGGLVFALGRHVAYKGFDVLIRAMTQLPGVGLVLGGTGPLWAEHLALVQSLGLQNRVYLPGRIEDADLPAWYHACDVFCLPSVGKTEAFGLVQLEAMACSKPVVCTALGNGVNDINQHGLTGLAATPGDPAALSGAIRQLLSDAPLRAAMGAQAHQRAVSAYSLDAMAQPMLKLYEALAGPRSHLRTASGKTSA
jgi:rhamnosyl/mannosyltransferase